MPLRNTISLMIALAWPVMAVAQGGALHKAPAKEEIPMSKAEATRLVPFFQDLEKKGAKLMVFDFNQAGGFALTKIVPPEDEDKAPFYTAEVHDGNQGPFVLFRATSPCEATPGESFSEVIKVNEQKIATRTSCKGFKGTTMKGYLPVSPAGREAVHNAFRSGNIVFVTLSGTEIPFLTGGFEKAWADASEPVL